MSYKKMSETEKSDFTIEVFPSLEEQNNDITVMWVVPYRELRDLHVECFSIYEKTSTFVYGVYL